MKPRAVRRIVTGHRADGRSTVLIDAPAPNAPRHPAIHRTRSIDYVIVLEGVFIDADEPPELAAAR